MRIKILSFFAFVMLIISCNKDDKAPACINKTPEQELDAMTKFAADSIKFTKDPSGILYQVIEPGTGTPPTATSTVKAKYIGQLLNKQVFDGAEAEFPLNGVIKGWQIGIPKISKGGHIKMIIPSSLAYDCAAQGRVPGYMLNQPLYFDVILTDVK